MDLLVTQFPNNTFATFSRHRSLTGLMQSRAAGDCEIMRSCPYLVALSLEASRVSFTRRFLTQLASGRARGQKLSSNRSKFVDRRSISDGILDRLRFISDGMESISTLIVFAQRRKFHPNKSIGVSSL